MPDPDSEVATKVAERALRVLSEVPTSRETARVDPFAAARERANQAAIAAATAARWLPIVGALGVAAYAYYDTGQVAKSAIELFEREIEDDG